MIFGRAFVLQSKLWSLSNLKQKTIDPSTEKLGQAHVDHWIKPVLFPFRIKTEKQVNLWNRRNISNNYMSRVILIRAIKHKSGKFIKLLTKGFYL